MFSRPTDSSFSGYVIGNKDLFLGLIVDLVDLALNKKSELDLIQDIQFLRIRLHLDLGEASRVQSLGDSCMRTPSILPQNTNLLGLRTYPGFIRGREIGKKSGILNRLFQGLE